MTHILRQLSSGPRQNTGILHDTFWRRSPQGSVQSASRGVQPSSTVANNGCGDVVGQRGRTAWSLGESAWVWKSWFSWVETRPSETIVAVRFPPVLHMFRAKKKNTKGTHNKTKETKGEQTETNKEMQLKTKKTRTNEKRNKEEHKRKEQKRATKKTQKQWTTWNKWENKNKQETHETNGKHGTTKQMINKQRKGKKEQM